MDDEIAALRAELAALRAEVATLRTGDEDAAPTGSTDTGRRVTRRGLLAAAVAGGAGLVATQVTTAAPAAAAPGGAVVMGASNDAGTTATTVTSSPSSFTPVFSAECTNQGSGISGRSGSGWGVDARSNSGTGLAAQSSTGAAIDAYSASGSYAAYIRAGNGIGVAAFSEGSYPGVRGQSDVAGAGVIGLSTYGYGLHGQSANGVAVRAEAGTDPTGSNAGPGTDAVYATAVNGYALHGQGGKAPLRLALGTKPGAPATGAHQAGEFYVDRQGALFYCTKAGTPGTWKKVSLVAP